MIFYIGVLFTACSSILRSHDSEYITYIYTSLPFLMYRQFSRFYICVVFSKVIFVKQKVFQYKRKQE